MTNQSISSHLEQGWTVIGFSPSYTGPDTKVEYALLMQKGTQLRIALIQDGESRAYQIQDLE